MTEEELTWLAGQASSHDRIVEIGCYQGRSTRSLGDNARGVVYAVDDWGGLREQWWIESTEENEKASLFERFKENLCDLLDSGKVIIVKSDHNTVIPIPCDMVFIDGDHRYESVKRDIETWLPVLVEGGIMCGHDSNQWPLMQAVEELLPGVKKAVGLIWTWTK